MKVRIPQQEGTPLATGGRAKDSAGADDAAASAAARQMQHGAAGKMPATSHQSDPVPKLERVAVPQLDRGILARDPFTIGGVEMDWAMKGVRPLHHRRVEMRM